MGLTRSDEHASDFQANGIHPLVGDVLDVASLTCLNSDDNRPFDTLLYAVARDRESTITMRDLYLRGLENVLSRIVPMPQRLIYISSTSVYGQDSGEWVDESSICHPTQENGRICHAAEELLWNMLRSHPECRGTVLRLAGIYGPGRLIARAAAIKAGEPIRGNPEAWLNLVHVDDAVRAVMMVDKQVSARETYLVVDNAPLKRQDYYRTLAKLLNAPEPHFENADNVPQSGTNKRCSNRKLRETLRFEFERPNALAALANVLFDA